MGAPFDLWEQAEGNVARVTKKVTGKKKPSGFKPFAAKAMGVKNSKPKGKPRKTSKKGKGY